MAHHSSPLGIRPVFLGSGSAGNCTAVEYGDTVILIDCGFSAREVARRMSAAGLDPARVSAILVTHEHGDHMRGIDVFVRRHAPGCVVHLTAGTARASAVSRGEIETAEVQPGAVFSAGALSIVAFRTSHDAAEPVGYRIEGGGEVLGLATDTGTLTAEALEALREVDVLGLEFNHDVMMLERGPYPQHLKRRILSARGHLSNADAADALEQLASDRLRCVVALHRSATNNTAALAESAVRERLARMGHPADAHVARQECATDPQPAQERLPGC